MASCHLPSWHTDNYPDTGGLSRDSRDAIESITRDKEVFSLYLKALASYEDLPYEERIRISSYFIRVFRVSELEYLHYLSRNIETVHFENSLFRLTDVMNFPGLVGLVGEQP